MSRIVWDQEGERLYETGVDHGVIYPMTANGGYENGTAWNGLTAVNDSPSGGEVTKLYADNIDYLSLMSVEELGLGVEAYTYPDEFAECDGSASVTNADGTVTFTGVTAGQQTRKHFGFIYRSLIGNDLLGTDYGYKIHVVFNCLASPSEKSHSTVNDSPEATTLSWDFATTKVELPNGKKTSGIEIDSTKVTAEQLVDFEDLIYGSATSEPTFPTFNDIIRIFTPSQTGETTGEG